MVLKTNFWRKCILFLLFDVLQLFMCQKWHYYSNLNISSLADFHKPPSKSWKGIKSKIPKNSHGTCFICNGFHIKESQLLNGILFKEKFVWNRLLYCAILCYPQKTRKVLNIKHFSPHFFENSNLLLQKGS